MQTRYVRRLGAIAAAVAVGAAGVATAGGAAGKAPEGGTAKIKMVAKGKDLLFTGPRKVAAGAKLDVINKTEPEQVGPHTFTLVKEAALPQTKKQMKDCERLKLELCMDIIERHEVNLETFEVGKPSVDAGKKGWDKSFGRRGDSWYTGAIGESQARKVSAKPGSTLHYFCLVHPFMQGKIKVAR